MPAGKSISGPKHKTQPTATSFSNSKSPQKKAAPTTVAPTIKPTPPPKIMAKPIAATSTKPNPPPKTMGQSTTAPTTKPNPPPKSTAQPTSKPLTRSTSQKSRRSDIPKKGPQKVKNAASHARRTLTRSAATETFGRASVKGKESETVFVSLSSEEKSSDSHDNYDSIVDEPYRPVGDDVSSEEEKVIVKRLIGKKNDVKKRTTTDKREVNKKRDVMLEDDGLVCADSGSEDDEFFFWPDS
nr:anther-specific proline-rich protein APG-like [Arachis hypogaea]